MKNVLIAALMLTTLAGCGTAPSMAPASKLAPASVGTRTAANASDLSVNDVKGTTGAFVSITGRNAAGRFELNLSWKAVPGTFLSRLSSITLNGKELSASAVASVQAELREAAKNPANAEFAKELTKIAREMGDRSAK